MTQPANVDRLTSNQLQESRSLWWSDEFTATLLRRLGPLDGQVVLDVGCGLGTLAQRLHTAVGGGFSVLGIDLDPSRLRGQRGVAAARAEALPFPPATFTTAVAILTLQHVPDRRAVLAEMRRVVRPGGLVLAVEADNLDQRMYLPAGCGAFPQAYQAFWLAAARNTPTVDFSLGPRLPQLFQAAGLPRPSVDGYLVTHARQSSAEDVRRRLLLLAERYDLVRSPELEALLAALEGPGEGDGTVLDSLATVPLFVVGARVAAGA